MEANDSISFCFVHGFGDGKERFSDLVGRLQGQGQFACSISLPDCRSQHPSAHLHDSLVDQIAAVFDNAPGGTRRVVVAHSLGGLLTIAHEKSPKLADRILLIEPSVRVADLGFFRSLASLPKGRRIDEFADLLSTEVGDMPDDYISKLREWTEPGFEAYCDLAIRLIPNASEALVEISEQVVLAYGRKSWGAEPGTGSSSFPQTERFEFEDSGHWPFVNEARQFALFLEQASRN